MLEIVEAVLDVVKAVLEVVKEVLVTMLLVATETD